MNVFLLLQGVVALVVVNVLVSRFAHRRNQAHRDQLVNDEAAVRQLDYKILEAQRHEEAGIKKIESLNDSIKSAEQQLETAEKQLEAARKASPDLYYVFDRLEPRPGIIWEVAVSRNTEVPTSARLAAVWRQPRRYLIAAKSPREAHDRAAQRFFEKTGLMIDTVSPCPLFTSRRAENAAAGGERRAEAEASERPRIS